MAIRITALGPLRVEQEGRVLERLPAQRMRLGILLYLGVEREATREQLMGMFWGDRPPERARHLLSQTLYELRQDLGDRWMNAAGEGVSATPELVVDAVELADAVGEGRYEDALCLYGGGFLSGATLALGRPFEGWVDAQQARIGRLHRQARRGAIDQLAEAGALEAALGRAREWVEIDPLDDEAQHRLIELMAATGDRSGALRQYDRYAALVAKELELEPLDDTRALVERIRDGEVGERRAPTVAAPVAAAPEAAPPTAASEPAAEAAPGAAEAPDRGRAGPPAPAPATSDGLLAGSRRRRLVRWTLTYIAASVVVLLVVHATANAFGWPSVVLRAAILLLGFGALAVHGAAWVQGQDRAERAGWVEAVMFGAVVIFAGVAVNMTRLPGPVLEAGEPAAEVLDPRRVAVLYLEDVSPDQDLKHLATGFTDALIHELGKVQGLEILSRTAVSPYRSGGAEHESIVRELRAGTLVGGNITRLEDRIRVMVQLMDGATGTHLMSTTLAAPPDSLTRLLEELPREVSRMLRAALGSQIELVEGRLATRSAEAWELVQRAEQLMEDARDVRWREVQPGLSLMSRADSLLERAAALDPKWPEPRLKRASVAAWRARAVSDVPSRYQPEATRVAIRHLDTLIQSFPEYAPAYQERGILTYELAEESDAPAGDSLYAAAEADLRQAVLLDPTLARAWWGLSELLRRMGSFAEAMRSAERALEVDAFLANSLDNLWYLFTMSLENEAFGEAGRWCQDLRQRYPDEQHWGFCELYLLQSAPGTEPDPDRAWIAADTVVALSSQQGRPIYRGIAALHMAKVLTRAGMPDSARAVFRRAFPDSVPRWGVYDAAHLHVMLDDHDTALEYLERHRELHPARAQSLARDWFFRPLQGDPRFERLVGRGPG